MEVHAAQLARGLAARGHHVEVLTTAHPSGITSATIDGAAYHFLAGTRPGAYSPEWWSRSTAWVREAPPFDVVLSESGAAEGLLKARLPVPLVVVCHGLSGWTLEGMWRGLGTTTTYRAVARMALTWAWEQLRFLGRTHQYDRIACVSEPLVSTVCRQWHYAPDRVICIPNGIDVSRFVEASRRLPHNDKPVILVSGRLEPDKGVHLALQAVARLAPHTVRLVIAGEGSARSALERHAAAVTQDVRFLGHRPVDEMPSLHAAADIYLFPTLLSESFGFGALEAMAAGKPVVAPPVGGLPMLVEHGVTGLACAVGDASSMAAALAELIADPARAGAMGAEGQRRAAARFTEAAMLDGFERLLRELAPRAS